MMKRLAVIAILWSSLSSLVSTATLASGLKVGDQPKLVATELHGESFDLSQKKGKWVMVHFFASWCPGCKTELPELVKLYQTYHAKNLEMILLSPEPTRKKKEVMDFIKAYPIPAALFADTKMSDFDASVALPTSYLINPKGAIEKIFSPEEKGTAFDADVIEKILKN